LYGAKNEMVVDVIMIISQVTLPEIKLQNIILQSA